jgi:hypothetical protein
MMLRVLSESVNSQARLLLLEMVEAIEKTAEVIQRLEPADDPDADAES